MAGRAADRGTCSASMVAHACSSWTVLPYKRSSCLDGNAETGRLLAHAVGLLALGVEAAVVVSARASASGGNHRTSCGPARSAAGVAGGWGRGRAEYTYADKACELPSAPALSSYVRRTHIFNASLLLCMLSITHIRAHTRWPHLDRSDIDDSMSGTTAIAVLVRGRTTYVANVGDSRAVLAERHGDKVVAQDLSYDQTPFRCREAGGDWGRGFCPCRLEAY